jgi:sirohydrochlorin ferrochelatase
VTASSAAGRRRRASLPAVLLVDHGSRSAAANRVVATVARRLARRLPGRVVRFAHMELAAPTIDEAVAACAAAGAAEIVVHPFFLAPGVHSRRDVPRLAREAARRHGVRVRVSPPLGVHDLLVDVILARIGLV